MGRFLSPMIILSGCLASPIIGISFSLEFIACNLSIVRICGLPPSITTRFGRGHLFFVFQSLPPSNQIGCFLS